MKNDGNLCKQISAKKESSTANASLKGGCLTRFSLFNVSVTALLEKRHWYPGNTGNSRATQDKNQERSSSNPRQCRN